MARKFKKDSSNSMKDRDFRKESPENSWTPNKGGKEERIQNSGARRGKGKPNSKRRDSGTQPHYAGSNDVRWYARNDQLLSNVGRLSFEYPAGTNIPYYLAMNNGFANTRTGINVNLNPGICVLNLIPTYGISTDGSSALNIAARALYNRIRMENSGARNYDQTDLMKYIIGVDSLFMFYAYMVRAYGILNNFTFHNKYTPEALCFAMGLDYQNLILNRPNFLNYINTYGKRLTTFMAPKDMPIFERHFAMISSIYKDSESPRAQYYMYNPTVLYRYKATAQPGESAFDNIYFRNPSNLSNTESGLGYADLVAIGDKLFAAMDDEDMVTMAGDMLKAFGEGGVWTQTDLAPDYTVLPIFDFTWLTQVQNSTPLNLDIHRTDLTGETANTENPYVITEIIPSDAVSPYIKTTCEWIDTRGPVWNFKRVINMPYDSPTPGDVMEATRLMVAANSVHQGSASDSNYKQTVIDCGSEICSSADIFMFTGYGEDGMQIQRRLLSTTRFLTTAETSTTLSQHELYTEWGTFAMHPIVYALDHAQGQAHDQSLMNVHMPFVNLDNYAIIGPQEIHNLHLEAILSELFAGTVGGNRLF